MENVTLDPTTGLMESSVSLFAMKGMNHPVEPSGVIFPLLSPVRVVTCPLMVGASISDTMASFQTVRVSIATAVVSLN